MPKLGCSTRLIIGVTILLLLLFLVGLVGGAIGSTLVGESPLSFIKIEKPHIELPAEPISKPLFGGFSLTNTLIASWFSIIFLAAFFYLATRKMKLIPGRLQSMAETIVEWLFNFVKGAAGEKQGRKFLPAVATIFLFVITNAYLALLPFFGPSLVVGEGVPLFRNANTDINMPLAFAIMSFIFVEFIWGMRALGFFRYLGQFFNVGQLFGGIKQLFRGKIRPAFMNIILGFINLFVGGLEALSHLIRLVSFTFRLFGNMTAGEVLLLVSCFLVPWILAIPFYGLELLIGFIQALIFAGLTLAFAMIAIAPHAEEREI